MPEMFRAGWMIALAASFMGTLNYNESRGHVRNWTTDSTGPCRCACSGVLRKQLQSESLCYNSLAMMETYLVPEKTTVARKGDGPALDVSAAANRVFLLTLNITDVIEQESLDISIFGSADGSTWTPKAIASFPQKVY